MFLGTYRNRVTNSNNELPNKIGDENSCQNITYFVELLNTTL